MTEDDDIAVLSKDDPTETLKDIKEIKTTYVCPLKFWLQDEKAYEPLAKLTKTYLSVQDLSASVERMCSIAGYIFRTKGVGLEKIFSYLILLKLNENHID